MKMGNLIVPLGKVVLLNVHMVYSKKESAVPSARTVLWMTV